MSLTAPEGVSVEPAAPETKPGLLLWPDFARIAAIIAVVVTHTVAGTVERTAFGSRIWWGSVMLDAATSWAVPVFAMLSGALLLAPDHWRGTATFYRRRLVRVGIPAVVWIAIYFAWRTWYLGEPFGLMKAWTITLSGFPFFHLYFLFVILGLYAITPFLWTLVHTMRRGEVVGLAAGCLVLNWFAGYLNSLGVVSKPNAATFFLLYIGYFLAGYVLREVVVTGWRLSLLVVGVAVTVVGETVESYALGGQLAPLYKYSALTTVMSLMIFVVFVQAGRIATARGWSGRSTRVLAGAAFGVYLVHPIVIALFTAQTGIRLFPATPEDVAATFAFTVVVSWIVIMAVRCVPVLKRIV